MFDPSYWFMLPMGILGASVGMSAGISASNFWIPIYLLWLGFEPRAAFWLSLATMMFGYSSGVISNIKNSTVDWHTVKRLMLVCGPAGLIGGYLSPHAPQNLLLALFGVFVLFFGSWTLVKHFRQIQDTPRDDLPWGVALVAASLQGLIATGLGKLLLPRLLCLRQMPHHAHAVGTVVVTVFFTSLCALVSRMNGPTLATLQEQWQALVSVLMWVAPGVIIGGQVGPAVSRKMPKRYLKLYVGGLLVFVGLLILIRGIA